MPAPARTHARNATATRQAILDAAKVRFSMDSYDHVGVRDIAADAGVDAALVNRYFGSKEKLFAEVIVQVFDAGNLRDIPREKLASDLAHYVAFEAPAKRKLGCDPLLLLLLSAPSQTARQILRECLEETTLGPVSRKIGGSSARLRAAMIVGILSGVRLMHEVLRSEAVGNCCKHELESRLTSVMEACIADESISPTTALRALGPGRPAKNRKKA